MFLSDVGAAAISLTAIPLSLLAALIVLDRLGFGINTLTLGGLAIALGEVVDDAIIDVENIARRLRENRRPPTPRSAARVVLEASLEVRSSVVYATFVVALVFVPVLTLTGVQGALFRPLGLAYILAILASLVVALTVTPALTLLLLGARGTPGARVAGAGLAQAPLRPGPGAAGGSSRRGRRRGGARLPRARSRRCRSSAPPSFRNSAKAIT